MLENIAANFIIIVLLVIVVQILNLYMHKDFFKEVNLMSENIVKFIRLNATFRFQNLIQFQFYLLSHHTDTALLVVTYFYIIYLNFSNIVY